MVAAIMKRFLKKMIMRSFYGDGVTDIDGNEYVTVIIGEQEWMAKNLRLSRYNNEDAIPTGLSDDAWENTAQVAYAIYN